MKNYNFIFTTLIFHPDICVLFQQINIKHNWHCFSIWSLFHFTTSTPSSPPLCVLDALAHLFLLDLATTSRTHMRSFDL